MLLAFFSSSSFLAMEIDEGGLVEKETERNRWKKEEEEDKLGFSLLFFSSGITDSIRDRIYLVDR